MKTFKTKKIIKEQRLFEKENRTSRIYKNKESIELKEKKHKIPKFIDDKHTLSASNYLFDVQISRKLSQNKGIYFTDGIHEIALFPITKRSVIGKLQDDGKLIFGKFNGTDDLIYSLNDKGIKEEIIVKEQREEYSYKFKMELKGLEANLIDDEKIIFLDSETKKEIFQMGDLIMIDGANFESTSIMLTLEKNMLTMSCSHYWINDEERVFPITIDPQIEIITPLFLTILAFDQNQAKIETMDGAFTIGEIDETKISTAKILVNTKAIYENLEQKNAKIFLSLPYSNGRVNDGNGFIIKIGEVVYEEAVKFDGEGVYNINLTKYINDSIGETEVTIFPDLAINPQLIGKFNLHDFTFADEKLRPSIRYENVNLGEAIETATIDKKLSSCDGISVNLHDGNYLYTYIGSSIKEKALKVGVNFLHSSIKRDSLAIKNACMGGLKTNFHQYLIKADTSENLIGSGEFIYIDGQNRSHEFYERWFYETKAGAKVYVDKNDVFLDVDQKLKYIDLHGSSHDSIKEVKYEIVSDDGLSLISADSLYNYKKSVARNYVRKFKLKLMDCRLELEYNPTNGTIMVPHFTKDSVNGTAATAPTWHMDPKINGKYDSYNSSDASEIETWVKWDYELPQNVKSNQIDTSISGFYRTQKYELPVYKQGGEYYIIMHGREERVQYEDAGSHNFFPKPTKVSLWTDSSIEYDEILDVYQNENLEGITSKIKQLNQTLEELSAAREEIYQAISSVNDQIELFHKESTRFQVQITLPYEGNSKNTINYSNHTHILSKNPSLYMMKQQREKYYKQLAQIHNKIDEYEIIRQNALEEQKYLIKRQKDSVNNLILDKEGNALGFDFHGKLIMIQDKYENKIELIYDQKNEKLLSIRSENETLEFVYDKYTNLLKYFVDTKGRKLFFSYQNSTIRSISPEQDSDSKKMVQYEFNADGNLLRITHKVGFETLLAYEAAKIINFEQISSIHEIAENGILNDSTIEGKEILAINPIGFETTNILGVQNIPSGQGLSEGTVGSNRMLWKVNKSQNNFIYTSSLSGSKTYKFKNRKSYFVRFEIDKDILKFPDAYIMIGLGKPGWYVNLAAMGATQKSSDGKVLYGIVGHNTSIDETIYSNITMYLILGNDISGIPTVMTITPQNLLIIDTEYALPSNTDDKISLTKKLMATYDNYFSNTTHSKVDILLKSNNLVHIPDNQSATANNVELSTLNQTIIANGIGTGDTNIVNVDMNIPKGQAYGVRLFTNFPVSDKALLRLTYQDGTFNWITLNANASVTRTETKNIVNAVFYVQANGISFDNVQFKLMVQLGDAPINIWESGKPELLNQYEYDVNSSLQRLDAGVDISKVHLLSQLGFIGVKSFDIKGFKKVFSESISYDIGKTEILTLGETNPSKIFFDESGRVVMESTPKYRSDISENPINSFNVRKYEEDRLIFEGTVNHELKPLNVIYDGYKTTLNLTISDRETDSENIQRGETTEGMYLLLMKATSVVKNRRVTLASRILDASGKLLDMTDFSLTYIDSELSILPLPIYIPNNVVATTLEITVSSNIPLSSAGLGNCSLSKGVWKLNEYDIFDRLIKQTSGGNSIQYSNFTGDNPTKIVSISNKEDIKTQIVEFDNENRKVFSKDEHGNIEEIYYNDLGDIIETRNYNEKASSEVFCRKYSFDEFGQYLPDENSKIIANTDLAQQVKDENGGITNFGYDYYTEELTSKSFIGGGISNRTGYKYTNNLLTNISHNGFEIAYKYDHLGRKTETRIANDLNPIMRTEYHDNFIYCSDPALKGRKVATLFRNGHIVESVFDKDDLLVSQTIKDFDTIIEIFTYVYDEEKRLIQKHRNGDLIETYMYHINGELNSMITNDISINYFYDSRNRLIEIETENKGIIEETNISYDKKDQIIHVSSASCSMEREYDPLDRITKMSLFESTEERITDEFGYLAVENGPTKLIKEHTKIINGLREENTVYTYDLEGNITEVLSDDNKIRYVYDKANRLIREDNYKSDKTFIFTYDSGGNITSKKEYQYTLDDSPMRWSSKNTYQYASLGHKDRLVKTNIGGEIQDVIYDDMGRPTSYKGRTLIWNKNGSLAKYGDTTFEYNFDGIRTKKNEKAYSISGTKILEESDGTTTLKPIYLLDNLVGFVYLSNKYYYSKNIQGDILEIYNGAGELVAKYCYDAWGSHRCISENGTAIYDSSLGVTVGYENHIGNLNPFRYHSYYFDRETNLYYLNSRYYDPEIGRFISADSVEYLDLESINGLNLYAYCLNNPISFVDPDGCAPKWWQWLVTGLLVVGGAVLCFVPGTQALGVSLLVAGGSMLASNIMSAAGVDGKIASIISSGLNIIAGVALMFTPFAGIGASMIGSGIGGIAGGFISEALGFRFETGAMIGGIVGGIAGGKVYDAYKVAQIAKQGTVVIGETMGRVTSKAGEIGAGTYGGMPGYDTIKSISPAAAKQLGLANNATWISRVYRSGVVIVDIGLDATRTMRSPNYAMEIARLLRWL